MNNLTQFHFQRAHQLSQMGRWQEAITEATECLKIEPQHYPALCTISYCFYSLGDSKKAMEFAEKAIQIDPTDDWAYRLQSAIYGDKKNTEKQLNSAMEAAKLAPDSVLTLQNLVNAQVQRGKYKEARQTANQLRQIAPNSAISYKTIGYVELVYKKLKEAEENFRQALQLEAEDYYTLNLLGETLMRKYEKTGSFKAKQEILNQAIDCFRQAVILEPTKPEAKKNLQNANLKGLDSHPFFILPVVVGLFVAVVFVLNHPSGRTFRPEFLKLDDRPPEILAFHLLSGLSLFMILMGITTIFTHTHISESNRKVIIAADKQSSMEKGGKFGIYFWFVISSYPLLFILWKLVTLDFKTFVDFKGIDWIGFSMGMVVIILNIFLLVYCIYSDKKLKEKII